MPGMYTDLTTKRVLVMEWVDGRRLKGQNRSAQAAREELKMVEIGVSILPSDAVSVCGSACQHCPADVLSSLVRCVQGCANIGLP